MKENKLFLISDLHSDAQQNRSSEALNDILDLQAHVPSNQDASHINFLHSP